MEEIIFTKQPNGLYETDGTLTPNKEGNIAVQCKFQDGGMVHRMHIAVSVDGTTFTYVGVREIMYKAIFHITGLIPGEFVKLICDEKCTAYVLH